MSGRHPAVPPSLGRQGAPSPLARPGAGSTPQSPAALPRSSGVIFTPRTPPGSHCPRVARGCVRDYSSPSSPCLNPLRVAIVGRGTLAPVPAPLRIAVRVRPGASRTRVGGVHGEGPEAPLVVAVSARAVDGAATAAVLGAVAKALGLRPRQVVLVRGATNRDKILEILDPPEDLADRLGHLREDR